MPGSAHLSGPASSPVSGSYGSGDGFVPVIEGQRGPADRPAPYEQASLSLRAVAPLAPVVELQANGLVFNDERERGSAFSDISTTGADASLRLVGSGAWRWSALGYVQTRDLYNSFAAVNAARTVATRTSEQYSVPLDRPRRARGKCGRRSPKASSFVSAATGAPRPARLASGSASSTASARAAASRAGAAETYGAFAEAGLGE
jgi:hypothetical protein